MFFLWCQPMSYFQPQTLTYLICSKTDSGARRVISETNDSPFATQFVSLRWASGIFVLNLTKTRHSSSSHSFIHKTEAYVYTWDSENRATGTPHRDLSSCLVSISLADCAQWYNNICQARALTGTTLHLQWKQHWQALTRLHISI